MTEIRFDMNMLLCNYDIMNIKPVTLVEAVEFNGIIFRRYPNSKRRSDRVYFRPQSKYYKHGIRYLHRELWKYHYGEIPENHHIHHKDENPLNNDISNLECVFGQDHLIEHNKNRVFPESIRKLGVEAAKSWHSSESGKKWHSEHSKKLAQDRPYRDYICLQCGSKFSSNTIGKNKPMFCNCNCRSKFYRKSKKYHLMVACEICRVQFSTPRPNTTTTCSAICAAARAKKNRKYHILQCKECHQDIQAIVGHKTLFCSKKCKIENYKHKDDS